MKKFLNRIAELIHLLVFRWKMKLAGIPRKEHYKIISLGLGQRSTALYLMSSCGFMERADVAVFSDTGSESKTTYRHLKWLKKWSKRHQGIPIICTGKKSLYRDIISGLGKYGRRFASIPAFTKDDNGKIGMLKRQCTQEYKTNEINKVIRLLYGTAGHKRTPATEVWLGITLEEKERMRYSAYAWLSFVYPFINYKCGKHDFVKVCYTETLRRSDCQKWLEDFGFPVPPKSACTFCPYQGNHRWRELKQHQPREWEKILELDECIRNSTAKGVKQPIYLHKSCKPLREADLSENQLELFNAECDGVCGI